MRTAEPQYDGADVIARYMIAMEPEELESIIADVNYSGFHFAEMVMMYAKQELQEKRRRFSVL